uniref:Uncharacterized protein n=1 Tax=Anopheles stephensi TaxID=30069 RepID=A0A182YMQ4_ANOST
MRKFAQFLRESASLTILARDGSKCDAHALNCNYKVLVFKCPEQTSFMPNAVVFSGRAFDRQGSTLAWSNLLPAIATDSLTTVSGPRSFIFKPESAQQERDRSIVPDVCNLYEWSTWITPTILHKKRFETAF